MAFWSSKPAPLSPQEVGVDDTHAALTAGTHTIVDVREPNEWREAHIDGAVHIPLGDLARRASEVPADKPVITICHAGARSLLALETLAKQGRSDVKSMAGGMVAWAGAGKPMTR